MVYLCEYETGKAWLYFITTNVTLSEWRNGGNGAFTKDYSLYV